LKRNESIISTEIELKKQELIKKCSWYWRQTAIYMLNATRAFTFFNNARKFVCYAGTAPLNIVRVRVLTNQSESYMDKKR
jgi:hypothetical protein